MIRTFMAKRFFLSLIILLVFINCSLAQSRKKIRNNQIISKTEWKYIYNNGKETKHKSVYFKYDKEGNIIEEISYQPDGTIKKKEIYEYNSDGDKYKAIRYDADGNITRKRIYKYGTDGIWIERITYDRNGNIIERAKRDYKYQE